MSKQHPVLIGTIALGMSAMLLSGCSSSPEENISDACEASAAYQAALKKFEDALTPDSTVEDIRSARNDVMKTHDDLVKASDDVARDRIDKLNAAEDEFNDAVDDLPDDATMTQATNSLKDETTEVESARGAVASELNC